MATSEPLAAESLPDTETTSKMSNLGLNGSDDQPPKKRAKLTPEEKADREKEKAEREKEREEKRKEKEEKEKERAKIKAEKEEQKRTKEEEKAKKDAERAAEKAKRDEEKAKKDEEKAKREEEKAKKERAQLRMDTFVVKKNVPSASTSETPTARPPTKPLGNGSTASNGMAPPPVPKAAVAPPLQSGDPARSLPLIAAATKDVEMIDKPDKPDFVKYFHPFFARPGVTVAPQHSFEKDDEATTYICEKLDREVLKRRGEDEMDVDEDKFQIPHPLPPSHFQDVFALPPAKRRKRGNLPRLSTKEVLAGLNRSPGPVPDFFTSKSSGTTDYVTELKKLPRKVFKYWEDIRPAYTGTYTRIPKTSGLRKGRNPFQKSLPGVDYDYDSEAEWVEEPDDDGEELHSEEEDDPMDVGSPDEMDDFLDDESEDPGKKRHNLSGPLIPNTSGLVWEDECENSEGWEQFRIGILTVGHATPIDPFSAKYWEPEKKKPPAFFQPPPVPSNHSVASSSRPGPPAQAPHGVVPLAPPAGNLGVPQATSSSAAIPPSESEATKSATGRPYAEYPTDPNFRQYLADIEKQRGKALTLGELASESFALQISMPREDQFKFFILLHKLQLKTSPDLSNICAFIEKDDRSKLGLQEELKRVFPNYTKAFFKDFVNRCCHRSGKFWTCYIRQNEHGYWYWKSRDDATAELSA
ncbi:hypothetical protein TWF696_003726 [Orbilia brochopaga]|uniref:Chromatin assembly factor 1 subunit A n=1 Tax=Orbilia brochopaga TaxID=3140254 RepID=A0AAV9V4M6_9PEZI